MDKDLESGGQLSVSPPDSDEAVRVNDLSFRAVEPVNISIQNLGVDIDISPNGLAAFKNRLRSRTPTDKKVYKTILQNVRAYMPSGSITAIIGGSGSGKTSMLNALSHRIKSGRLETSGSIMYNGNTDLSTVRSAYVMQQDILLETLTVRETLTYAAELRLPPPVTHVERSQIVEEVIQELSLKECADTRIGNNVHKGCSGGEKRRTSLGVQMLANPSVLYLDEVTTGLDATTAFQLIRTLKTLAKKGRTIVVTIHQPRSEIWALLDYLVLLSGGSPLYSGPVAGCLPNFELQGHILPAFVNPADFIIDLAAVDTRTEELEAASLVRVNALKQYWVNHTCSEPSKPSDEKFLEYHPSSTSSPEKSLHQSTLGRQINVLTRRTLKITYRDPMGMASSLFEATSMAILQGWIFLKMDGSLAGIRSRQGALYTAASLQGYLILLFEIYRLTIDIKVFDREYGEGVVGVSSFLLSRRLARCLTEDLPVPLIFSVIFYFMCGFRAEASQFFTFLAVTLLMQYIAISFASVCVAVSRNFAGASLIANMGYTIQSIGCGYFVQSNQIPVYMRWLKVYIDQNMQTEIY